MSDWSGAGKMVVGIGILLVLIGVIMTFAVSYPGRGAVWAGWGSFPVISLSKTPLVSIFRSRPAF